MAEDPQYHNENKRKFEDPSSAPRRASGFSSASPDGSGPLPPPPSYNNVPPPVDDIQLAKQRAQEIAARLFSAAEAKRPRVDGDGGGNGFGSDISHKPLGQPITSTQVGLNQPAAYPSYGYSGSSKKIDIPNDRVGVIIGKGGETIKYLQLQSGAKIQVTRDMDADPSSMTRLVELTGTSEQISKAEQLITDVLAEAEAGGSGIVTARKFMGAEVGSEHVIMKVPNNKVGLVIGKGGETIKSMQATSGARIQLIPLHPPPGDTSTERTVHIDGTPEQIESAKQLINEVVSENRPRNPQSGGYSQQGYRPPRPSWAPPGPPAMQQPGYGGYMQPGSYPGAPPQYMTQPNYSGYQTAPATAGYPSTGWDPSTNPSSQQTAPGTGYDYYSQQGQQAPPQGGSTGPTDNTGGYGSYGQSQPPSGYSTQGSYGDASGYSQQAPGYSQDGNGGSYQTSTQPQQGYPTNQPSSTQPGYDQQQSYSSAQTYPQDSSAVPAQAPPPTAPGYISQSGYSSQGSQPGYGVPPTSQAAYGTQQPTAYGQPSPANQSPYGQSPTQKPTTQQQPVSAYAHSGYGGNTQPPSAQYGSYPGGPPSGYGPPVGYGQSYGAPPQQGGQSGGYSQQTQPAYGDSYGSTGSGYSQTPAYANENPTGGPGVSAGGQAVPKSSPTAQS